MPLRPISMPMPMVAPGQMPTPLARPAAVPPPGVPMPMPDPAALQREELLKMMSPDGMGTGDGLPTGLTMPKPYAPPMYGAGRRSQ